MQGILQKMEAIWGNPVQYKLSVGDIVCEMNDMVGKKLSIRWQNQIICMHCGKTTRKSFGQGYCYPCFIKIPETEACVLNPEKCQAHLGIARDMTFAQNYCLQDHYVYLALTCNVKVGVTRHSQVPVRWIDQGAWRAIRLAKTPNRYTAGLLEVELKKILPDKTNWRNMLKNVVDNSRNLQTEKQRIAALLPGQLAQYLCCDNDITEINYPVVSYPTKPESIDLERMGGISGKLTGIKGQYLLFEGGQCLNVRKHGGYVVELEW